MLQSYINYDDMINFLNLIRTCDYGGLLAFQTDEEFEASQITIDVIENRIKELKRNIENRL